MAFLVPLILPSVVDATANVALGITNAVQGTSSSVTFQIGRHVYTSAKPFPLHKLPPEIREEIILMALEVSKELIQESILVSRPFTLSPTPIPLHNPLHDPKSPHYRSIRGEWQVTNGYPISAWRWPMVNREWRDVCRRRLWREIVLDTPRSYRGFLKFLVNGQLDDILDRVQSLQLDQGFGDPADLYQIIRHPKLLNLRRLAILTSWPYSTAMTVPPAKMFEFGLQLVPAPPALLARESSEDDDDAEAVDYERAEDIKRLDCLTLGLPLDLSTNTLSRQHLSLLRPKRLEIALLLQPHASLLAELAALLESTHTHLSVRYLASERAPVHLPDPSLLLDPSLDVFPTVDIHLPAITSPGRPPMLPNRPYDGQPDPQISFSEHLVDLISLDPARRKRYAVYLEGGVAPMGAFGPGWMKPEERVIWEREVDLVWPGSAVGVNKDDTGEAVQDVGSSVKRQAEGRADAGEAGEEHWERETNLKLLGGLISLRLESKKH
ncbi:hypothetical protein NliqN6_6008 [Naganishia liquefaciens]|uniref:F-box domain-containing protein n=1 Tax=Naganishia liquefaciens TaxID=104408 RepID=A0A8H3YJK6_9TREE|nr:hypothetical protein NliqN6_6008 [Naganishia liquefaciens]